MGTWQPACLKGRKRIKCLWKCLHSSFLRCSQVLTQELEGFHDQLLMSEKMFAKQSKTDIPDSKIPQRLHYGNVHSEALRARSAHSFSNLFLNRTFSLIWSAFYTTCFEKRCPWSSHSKIGSSKEIHNFVPDVLEILDNVRIHETNFGKEQIKLQLFADKLCAWKTQRNPM